MKKDSFEKGAFVATICIFITKILGVLYVIPFYMIITTKGSALYSYAYNVYAIFLAISTAGIPLALSKITSEFDAKKMSGSYLRLPDRSELNPEINESLIVEFYNR